MINFTNISYLKTGNEKQQKSYKVLAENDILEKLSSFAPTLVGTIPINIDIANSDLDIICYVPDKQPFISTLKRSFSQEKGFIISENPALNAVKATFFISDFEFEIFGQNIETTKQNGYRHMLIEHKILLEKGETFRQEIIKLKEQGTKTEPAFAKLLGLEGNPYEALLKLTF